MARHSQDAGETALAVRPFGSPEWLSASAGALALLIMSAVQFRDLPHLVANVADVLLFLVGLMLVSSYVTAAGVFVWTGDRVIHLARHRGPRLYVLLYLMSAIITAFLSLDVSVVVMTPLVLAIVRRAKLPVLPFLLICPYAANIPSLLLPVSNLTNLLVVDALDLPLRPYLAHMALPNVVAGIVSLLLLMGMFRQEIPATFGRIPDHVDALGDWGLFAGGVLLITMFGLVVSSWIGLELWWISLGAAALLTASGFWLQKFRVPAMIKAISPGIFVFVIAMTVVVAAAEDRFLADFAGSVPESKAAIILVSAGGAAVASNLINNIPVALVGVTLSQSIAESSKSAFAYSVLVGANIGPALTTFGSLATMIWLTMVRQSGLRISSLQYLRVSIVIVPITLTVTTLTLLLIALV